MPSARVFWFTYTIQLARFSRERCINQDSMVSFAIFLWVNTALYSDGANNQFRGSITDLNVSPEKIKLQKSLSTDDSFELLEKTYYGLYLAFNQHCKVTRKYLEAFEKDPYLLLAEYCTRWNSYSATILEFESTLGSLADKINDLYQQNFPDYPQTPEFSIWRLMVPESSEFSCLNSEPLFIRRRYGTVRFTAIRTLLRI